MGEPAFGVLGPLRVMAERGPVHLGGPKPRAFLATLLLPPGGFVSVDQLTEVLWPGGPPRSALANLRTYAHSLRTALAQAGVADAALRTESLGYALDLSPGRLDLSLFEQRLEAARAAREKGRPGAALRDYESALGLWRGTVLQDVPASVVWDAAVSRIEELRTDAVDECLELRLQLGEFGTVVAELRARLGEDPLREDLWQMLVRALHDSGRTTQARAAYAEAEQLLAAELGVQPGAPLRDLGERVGGHPRARRHAAHTTASVCQLPLDIPDFTGRQKETAALETRIAAAGRQPVVVVLSGPPGSGKSTLAVHVAHRVRESFPDGQLFVDLGAMGDHPRQPADILAELLRGLGVVDSVIPAGLAERAALFRSRLAQRRLLLLLEDAAGSEQVRPLLPGTGGSVVMVTSRRRLPGLPAHNFPLGLMQHADAHALLGAIVGHERLSAETAEADRVLDSCGSLPLAVRIAGSRLANRPGWTVATLADFLDDERGRLDQLQVGELEVRASAELSYRHLPTEAAAAFRAIGGLADEAVPGWLLAVAGGLEGPAPAEVELLLDEHLLETAGADRLGQPRYRMHNLLRCYARELADRDPPVLRRERQLRVTDALIALAHTANESMPSRFLGVRGEPTEPRGAAAGALSLVRARPLDWFESERRILVGAAETALHLGSVRRAADLTVELAGFFDMRFYYDDWLRTHRLVLEAMPAQTDARAAALLRNLGQLHYYQDRYQQALDSFVRARSVFTELGHLSGQGVAAVGTGAVHRIENRSEAALASFTEALGLFRQSGDRHGEAVACNAIASVWLKSQNPGAAEPWLDEALGLARELGDRHREAQVRRRIAARYELLDEQTLAQGELESALAILDELDDTHCAAYVQQSIGELYLRRGETGRASVLLTDALAVQQQHGDRSAEARVACLLGELHHAHGRHRTARSYFHRSLSAYHGLGRHDQVESVTARLRALP